MKRWVAIVSLIGCSGDPQLDTAAEAVPARFPADTSAEGMAAWLDRELYVGGPWTAETETPRPENSNVSPHGVVRVHLNDILVASQQQGNGTYGGAPHPAGSMVVKELYGEEARVGVAAMLKLDGGAADWVYWCDGPADRCGVQQGTPLPVWGVGFDASACAFCHGGLVFNEL